MTPHSVPVLIACVLTFYVGIIHLLVYAPRTIGRAHLSFGVACMFIVIYDVLCIGLYNVDSVAHGVFFQRGQFFVLAILSWAVPWFVLEYLNVRHRPWSTYWGALCLLIGVMILILPSSVTLQDDMPSIKHVSWFGLFWVTYYEATPGLFANFQSIFGLVVITGTLAFCIRELRRRRREALPILIAISVFGIGIISDTLISLGMLDAPYTIEYAYLGLVLVMTVPLTRAVADAARMRNELAAEKEQLLVTLRSIGDGVITTDSAGNILLMNDVAENLTGWNESDSAGRPLKQVFVIRNEQTGQLCKSPVERVLESGSIAGMDNHTVLVARDGTERIIADSGAPIRNHEGEIVGVVLVFRDVTERQRLEEKLIKAQRLESLGILAGGIAHDFNNLLTGVYGNIDIARNDLPSGESRDALNEAMRTLTRARNFSQQLLIFSRGGAPDRRILSLRTLLEENTRFALSGTQCTAAFEIDEDLWPCRADPNQIGQVIDNLVINAQQAMPGGGTVRVMARNVNMSESLYFPQGEYIQVAVADTGVGIDPENLSRIFEPFFTTKQRGSGLGLATTYSIIQGHGGHIEVTSRPGQGTTFQFYLPALPDATPERQEDWPALRRGAGRVLVMDDEPVVRTVTARMLKSAGYEVETAADGDAALALIMNRRDENRPFKLCLLDLTVASGRGGEEICAEVRTACPGLPIIAVSGYSESDVMARPEDFGFTASLRKPFTTAEITQLAALVLDKL
jgi:PAS domain S-box-containing protein